MGKSADDQNTLPDLPNQPIQHSLAPVTRFMHAFSKAVDARGPRFIS